MTGRVGGQQAAWEASWELLQARRLSEPMPGWRHKVLRPGQVHTTAATWEAWNRLQERRAAHPGEAARWSVTDIEGDQEWTTTREAS